jgi:hypothetical protein
MMMLLGNLPGKIVWNYGKSSHGINNTSLIPGKTYFPFTSHLASLNFFWKYIQFKSDIQIAAHENIYDIINERKIKFDLCQFITI